MAAGDFIVRRNVSDTTTMGESRNSATTLDFDTPVDNEGSGITESAGVHTLGETGRFLVMASALFHTDDTTNNERKNWDMNIYLAGALLREGMDTGYIRKSGGQQDYITQVMAYVNVATTTGNGDELEIRHVTMDDVTVGTLDRVANDRSGISIIKLDDTWNYAHYRSSAAYTPSATNFVRNQADLGTTVEEDGTVFNRTGNVVTVHTPNPILVMWTHKNDITDTTSGRTEAGGSIDFDGGEVAVRGFNQTYGPRSQGSGDDTGGMTGALILYPDDTDQDLELNLISWEDMDEDWFSELQIIELPSTAETATVERTTAAGNFNAAGVDFAWQAQVELNAAAFTYVAGEENIDVDNADDYIAIANAGTVTDAGYGSGSQRDCPAIQFRVNTTDSELTGASSYNRMSGTAEHAHAFIATLLPGLSANDTVQVRADRMSNGTDSRAAVGGFSLIRLSSLFGVPDQPLTLTGASVSATAGTVTVTTGPADLAPTGASVGATAGTVTVVTRTAITPSGATVSVTAGGLTIATGPANLTPTGATVTVTPASLTVSDDTATPSVGWGFIPI